MDIAAVREANPDKVVLVAGVPDVVTGGGNRYNTASPSISRRTEGRVMDDMVWVRPSLQEGMM